MATIICSSCGTRNPAEASTCRRCEEPLGDVDPSTAGGESAVLQGRWEVGGPLPGTDNPYLYVGQDLRTESPVLVKRLSRAAARDRTVRGKLDKEADVLAGLEHAHVVDLVDVVDDPNTPALILDAPGRYTLAELLARRGRLPVGIALEFALQLLGALEYLHARRVTHRRLMPTKVLVGAGPDKGLPVLSIVDLGRAHRSEVKSLDELEYGSNILVGVKATDTVSGSALQPYQAPEQLSGQSDAQSDIYSLGVMFFEMLTGDLPLSSTPGDRGGNERSIRSEEPTSVRLLRPEVSAQLDTVVLTMLSKDPDLRFRTIDDVREALVQTWEAEHDAMVAIPQGPFVQGSMADEEDVRGEEQPQREVFLDAYFVDRTPVTVADYKTYLDATGTEAPDEWASFNDVEHAADQPVVFVNWRDACEYARWAGKRLPTEAEWEKAARGTDSRRYPWGDASPTDKRACYDANQPAPVGARPFGSSPLGVQEMAGNVFEWVQDWYAADAYSQPPTINPGGPADGEKKVIRGGSFAHGAFALRCATRGRYRPQARRANHGFRCAWSLQDES